MLSVKDMIRNQFKFGDMLIQSYLGDLDDADLLVRSVPGANHIAWQMGHLISSAQHILKELGHESAPLPAGFAEAHAKDTSASDDPARFAAKDEYLRLQGLMLEAMNAALDKTPESVLEEPGPEAMREYAPTKADIFMLLGNHLAMHAGQFVPIRRKLGKPALF
ncbi:MAG: DinB family protein [Pirellulales bacterium]|nr:DinB family protein [Pirellulales bacterium]